MSEKNAAVFGIFANRAAVAYTLGSLRDCGFREADVSVLIPEDAGTLESLSSTSLAIEKSSKAPEAAVAGAGSGAAIGGALGWLVGIGAVMIPGFGMFIAAGPIVAALAGIGLGGAIGGLTGVLVGLDMPEYEAKRYVGRVERGGLLLSVHCDNPDWVQKALAILSATGAEEISSTNETAAKKLTNSAKSGEVNK
ncbi:MAG: DUF3341 domain-containing protein [Candidatus Dormiibacterota bacterium]